MRLALSDMGKHLEEAAPDIQLILDENGQLAICVYVLPDDSSDFAFRRVYPFSEWFKENLKAKITFFGDFQDTGREGELIKHLRAAKEDLLNAASFIEQAIEKEQQSR